jgi:hypothetical protein
LGALRLNRAVLGKLVAHLGHTWAITPDVTCGGLMAGEGLTSTLDSPASTSVGEDGVSGPTGCAPEDSGAADVVPP